MQVSRKKISAAPLVSPSTRLLASETNATKRPSALIAGRALAPLGSAPSSATETASVCGVQSADAPWQVSRRKISFVAVALDLTRGIIDMYRPRKRLDVGTWGVMGIGQGYAIAAAVETGKPVLAIEGDSAFGFSGMEIETICRYKLPVCIVIFNNDGIYRGTDVNPLGTDPATTVFVKGSRYDKMIEAFGGVGVNATSPDELKRAVNAAMDSGKPTLINAVIDPAAGSESGRIGNLNPQSKLKKK